MVLGAPAGPVKEIAVVGKPESKEHQGSMKGDVKEHFGALIGGGPGYKPFVSMVEEILGPLERRGAAKLLHSRDQTEYTGPTFLLVTKQIGFTLTPASPGAVSIGKLIHNRNSSQPLD